MAKKLTFINSEVYRVLYVIYNGDRKTKYYRCSTFLQAVKAIQSDYDMYKILTITSELENSELVGKEIIEFK